MTVVFSGGCVYELWRGSNEYGLTAIELIVDTCAISFPKIIDFTQILWKIYPDETVDIRLAIQSTRHIGMQRSPS
jgi:hypothetical protein